MNEQEGGSDRDAGEADRASRPVFANHFPRRPSVRDEWGSG